MLSYGNFCAFKNEPKYKNTTMSHALGNAKLNVKGRKGCCGTTVDQPHPFKTAIVLPCSVVLQIDSSLSGARVVLADHQRSTIPPQQRHHPQRSQAWQHPRHQRYAHCWIAIRCNMLYLGASYKNLPSSLKSFLVQNKSNKKNLYLATNFFCLGCHIFLRSIHSIGFFVELCTDC